MKRRIVVMTVAILGLALAGCGPETKATIPTQTGPALGDDSAGEGSGGKAKGKPKQTKGEAASDG